MTATTYPQPDLETIYPRGYTIPNWIPHCIETLSDPDLAEGGIGPVDKGYAAITRSWEPGDRIDIEFP